MDIGELVNKATDAATVGRAFGPSRESDGTVIVPVAWTISVGGGGGGQSIRQPADSPDSEPGSGGGGGFVSIAWPLGVYSVKGEHVRWVPAVDTTLIAIAGIALIRAVVTHRQRRRATAQ